MAMRGTLTWLKRIFFVAAFAALPGAPAFAGACDSGDVCTFELTNTNIFNTVPGDITIDIRVTVDNSGAATILTFDWISDNLTNDPLGFDQIFWNSATTGTSAGWALAANCFGGGPPPCNADGFGDFLAEYDQPAGTDLSVSFTLDALVTDFPENESGGEFAVHIRYDGGCSSFVSDGTTDQSPNSTCIPIRREVPEPGSLLLLAVGILALGLARRRTSVRR